METNQVLIDTAERIFADHCDKAALDRAELGEFPRALADVVEENGLALVATAEMGGTLVDAFAVLRVAGRHAVPLPLAETMLAHHLAGLAGCTIGEGAVTLAIADAASGEGAEVNVQLGAVPWARACRRVCYVIGDPVEVVLLDTSACDVVPGRNIAGEARDAVAFVGLPARCGAVPYTVARVFELMALSRCALMSGALERILELSVRYAEEREQFGRAIGKFQAVQHQLALLACEVAAALRATDAAVAELDSPRFDVAVAAAKSRVGEAAGVAAEIAHQVHGAMGFTHEHTLHHFTRRLLAWRDEYGRETHWQTRLGRRAASVGADRTWELVVGR
jgi:alkylation response protein AidB-like acyl-CoA dehydrogenase